MTFDVWDTKPEDQRQVRGLSIIENALLAQRGHLFAWVPVCLGIGIAGYFMLPAEPAWPVFAALGLLACALMLAARIVTLSAAPLLIAAALMITGACLAKYRTHAVAGPVLDFRYYGPIAGRVVNVDRSGSDAPRLTLDRVVLARMDPDDTPLHVRISDHGDREVWVPGDVVMTTGHLSPPSGPAEPGGFDFQRHAWFLGLGGVGYTRNPILRSAAGATDTMRAQVNAVRLGISRAVRKALPSAAGAFAAAIMTGDRSGMQRATIADLRAANLAHLLAISGLHMGLLVGFIFAVVRSGLACIPRVALHYPTKKIAAICALLVGAVYLVLSGGSVATERAYIMVAMMLVAVLLDRQALTLRAVAMAATLILVLHPEALVGPGFQMSFAATTALVVAFRGLRHVDMQRLPKWSRPILGVVISSGVAGLATAPFAAAHFNQIAHFGLIANVLSVPVMGIFVMPAAVLAVCLAPFGLWGVGLWLMEKGLAWILFVAGKVAAIDGGLGHVVAPQPLVIGILTLGLIWMILWQGRLRIAGLAPAVFAFFYWGQADRPTLLVADNGAMIGLMSDAGRILSKAKGSSFVAGIWLENDGAPVDQAEAAAREGLRRSGRKTVATLGAHKVLQVSGKTALAALRDCDGATILITNMMDAQKRSCTVYDQIKLRETGALAITLVGGRLITTTAQQTAGDRPWNPPHPP